MQFSLRRTASVAVVALAVAVSSNAFAAPPASSALTTEKDKVSYAIGLRMAASLQDVKGDVDPAVLTRAINTSLTGGKPLMTDAEVQSVLADFGKQMQAKQQAVGMKNLTEGSAFLTANGKKPGVKTTASGLQYQVLKAGNGAKPKVTDRVMVNYVGQTLDGKTFDSTALHPDHAPSDLGLTEVIPGWTEGLQLMPVGSKYVFWIPAPLAYGAPGKPPIGPNETLRFEVELVSIDKK
jgi:FKBP-type peptidyl-prolyl cis-trans isomerase FkpA